ncbi:unnamed protein product, partial [Allacma fusca]
SPQNQFLQTWRNS